MQLRILRFTPAASSDHQPDPERYRPPGGHIVANLVGYDRLVSDVQAVSTPWHSKDAKVQTVDGLWYLMRIRPYRTLDNVIERCGDHLCRHHRNETDGRLAHPGQCAASLRLAVVVRDASDAITVQDLEGRILSWNPAAVKMYGWTEAEALQMNVRERMPPALRDDALVTLREFGRDKIPEPYHTQRLTKSGTVVEVLVTVTALLDEAGHTYAMATTERVRDAPSTAISEG
jgi:two-component system CheB/CheR fusion protein